MLLVLAEGALESLRIFRDERALAVEHVVQEVADVAVAAVREEIAEALALVFSPETNVEIFVAVETLAVAVAGVVTPLAFILVVFLFVKRDKAAYPIFYVFRDNLTLVCVTVVISYKSFFSCSLRFKLLCTRILFFFIEE